MHATKVKECEKQENRTPLGTTCGLLIAVIPLLNLTGCITAPNGFSQFYQDKAGPTITNLLPYCGTTKIYGSANLTNDVKDVFGKGYSLIGRSSFHGPPQADGALMSQAKKVGADLVLVSSTYLGSQQTIVPWVQYHPGQTYTTTSAGTFDANVWGSGASAFGTGSYLGTSTTTTPGTFSTEAIPVTVHLYSYDAAFFRKAMLPILGVWASPLSPAVRAQLERNAGIVVWAVMRNSPAFNANILEGDVILKMQGEDMASVEDYRQKLVKFAGQKVDIDIWRNGQFKTISVQLNSKP